ncbi:hypothetical protein JB92DRAFT_3092695 [Gautieria morchelliformis]|nr:hypothetical protein JB92DRAFT_3092695 [Gautieria morchelliformis]
MSDRRDTQPGQGQARSDAHHNPQPGPPYTYPIPVPYIPRLAPPGRPPRGTPSGNLQGGHGQPLGSHHVPSPEHSLVQPFGNLSLGQSEGPTNTSPPVPSQPPSGDDILGKLRGFFPSTNHATRFLQNFAGSAGKKRKKTFLDMFAPAGAGNNSSQGEDVMDSMKSAEEFLAMHLPIPITIDASNAVTSESAKANHIFREDPLYFRYLDMSASDTRRAVEDFHIAIGKVKRLFYDDHSRNWFNSKEMLLVRVMNEVLKVWYVEKGVPKAARRIVSIRAQYQPPGMIKGKCKINAIDTQHVLVIYESKRATSLKPSEWDAQVEMCKRQGPIKLYSESGKHEMEKMIPQVRK